MFKSCVALQTPVSIRTQSLLQYNNVQDKENKHKRQKSICKHIIKFCQLSMCLDISKEPIKWYFKEKKKLSFETNSNMKRINNIPHCNIKSIQVRI